MYDDRRIKNRDKETKTGGTLLSIDNVNYTMDQRNFLNKKIRFKSTFVLLADSISGLFHSANHSFTMNSTKSRP